MTCVCLPVLARRGGARALQARHRLLPARLPMPRVPATEVVEMSGLHARIQQAEDDLNAALEHAQDLAIARRQVREALDDLRVYRSVLALREFALPAPSREWPPPVPVPAQQRRRVATPEELAARTPRPYRPVPRPPRDEHGRFVSARGAR